VFVGFVGAVVGLDDGELAVSIVILGLFHQGFTVKLLKFCLCQCWGLGGGECYW